jgi:hypothetical protein
MAVGSGMGVGSGAGAGAQAARTKTATSNRDTTAVKRFIFLSLYNLQRFCLDFFRKICANYIREFRLVNLPDSNSYASHTKIGQNLSEFNLLTNFRPKMAQIVYLFSGNTAV